MNTTYLIDLENVNSGGFEGANGLDETDELIVFYSEKADTLKIPTIRALLFTKAEIKFYKSKNGIMNAMDFDIVSVLGIVYNTERSFVIVSRDKGFDVVVERYRSFGKANVTRRVNIGAANQRQEPVPEPEPTAEPEPIAAEPEVAQTPEPMTEPPQPSEPEEISYSAPDVPEIEPDKFEAEISKAMELTAGQAASAQAEEKQAEPGQPTEPSLSEIQQPEPQPQPRKRGRPRKTPLPNAPKAPAPNAPAPKAPVKKKKPAAAEMSRAQKGMVNQFLNNLMGAKHKPPFTKDELKIIRETAETARNKTAFYNALRSRLGSEKGIELYKEIKNDYDKITEYIKDIKK